MSSLIESERELYADLWSGVESYAKRSPGEGFVNAFCEMAQVPGYFKGSVLDAGCGSGKGALALMEAGFAVQLCDLTDAGLVEDVRTLVFHEACLWDDLLIKIGRFDYVYCCDVLEHIPPAFTMLTVARLLQIARKGVFLSIAFVPDEFGVWAGRPLHLTVESFVWWRDSLNAIGQVKECRDLLQYGLFFVVPR